MNYIVKYDTPETQKPLTRFGGYPSFLNRMFLKKFEPFGPAHASNNGFKKTFGDITVRFEDMRLWLNMGYKIKPFKVYSYRIVNYKWIIVNEGFEFDDPDGLTENEIDTLIPKS